jgi:hypothetical protein
MAWLRIILGKHLFEWLLVKMYFVSNRIFRHSDEPTWRNRAEHIRKVSGVFERAYNTNFGFPVILSEAQTCQVCDQETFVVVHPDTICDSCWLKLMSDFQQSLRALREKKMETDGRRNNLASVQASNASGHE